MKKFNALVLASALSLSPIAQQQAHAVEIVGIVVGGSVVSLSIVAASTIRFKAQDYSQALDVAATGDVRLVTPSLARTLAAVRASDPMFAGMGDLALITTLLENIDRTL